MPPQIEFVPEPPGSFSSFVSPRLSKSPAHTPRPGVPLSIEDAGRLVGRYVNHYNGVRLHSAIGYVAPLAKLEGRESQIFAERDHKLETARRQRQLRRQEASVSLSDRSGDSSTATLN